MDFGFLSVFLIAAMIVYFGVKIVPQQQVWMIERLGRYYKSIDAGMHLIIPFMDRVAYKHTLKERAVEVARQYAITKDNVSLQIDGILYVRIINPKDASYGVENPYFAVSQLAQTSMRSAIGKITMDKTFEERESLNLQIVQTINEAASNWGIQCMRYEIKDIEPPTNVLKAMELQVAAERQKRAEIFDSEGKQQAKVNLAEANKREVVLNSEALLIDQVNRAKGEAEAIALIASATAEGIRSVGQAIGTKDGKDAVSLRIAEKYVEAFKELAKQNNTLIVPANSSDIGSSVAQALTIFDSIRSNKKKSEAN